MIPGAGFFILISAFIIDPIFGAVYS
jgi:hypothetical protein